MIDFDAAVRTVLQNVQRGPVERRATERALGLVLARPVRARFRLPRTDQSAMDGVAVHCADVAGATEAEPAVLRVAGEIPAGSNRRLRLKRGAAIRVYTGSALPAGAETVVMVEHCRFDGERVEVTRPALPGAHLRRAGEEVSRGDLLFGPGTQVTPPVIGLVSLLGIEKLHVFRPPRVAVITMGDEIVAPGRPLSPVQVHDANGPAVKAALRGLGIESIRTRLVPDRPARLLRALAEAVDVNDVVITIGGASVGDHDHVHAVRAELGVRELFATVAMKPGKPNVFGVAQNGVPIFSLPGNPVSALVSFQHFVRPALNQILGRPPISSTVEGRARLGQGYRKKPGRREFVRGVVQGLGPAAVVRATAAQGSHMLTGLARAEVLIDLDSPASRLEPETWVRLRRLNWMERG